MNITDKITVRINDEVVSIQGEKAFMTLGNYLRNEALLTGTKIVCAEGDCGACSVLLAKDFAKDGKLSFKTVNSCILPLYLVNGAQVVTVEGIGKKRGMEIDLHEVQEKMIECGGTQCGYCTPGFICAMAGMAEKFKSENKKITKKNAKNYLTGNLCRCTGYQSIIEAMASIEMEKVELLGERYHQEDWACAMEKNRTTSVHMRLGKKDIFLPVKLSEALKIKNDERGIKIIAGATDLGVVVNKGKMATSQVMALGQIQELKKISFDKNYILVGAGVTLTEFEEFIESHFPEMTTLLHIFASLQIKNQGTLVGNVVNASPIADTIPFLMVSDAIIEIKNLHGEREVFLKEFYQGYKKINLFENEIVTKIKIPILKKTEKTRLYKVSMRKDLDISAVTFAARINFVAGKMTDVKIALGGVAANVIRMDSIEKKLENQLFSEDFFVKSAENLAELISPLSDLRASKEYRLLVAKNYFKKFASEIASEL